MPKLEALLAWKAAKNKISKILLLKMQQVSHLLDTLTFGFWWHRAYKSNIVIKVMNSAGIEVWS